MDCQKVSVEYQRFENFFKLTHTDDYQHNKLVFDKTCSRNLFTPVAQFTFKD